MDRPCQNCHQYFDIRENYGKCPYCLTDNFKNKNMKNFKDGQKVRHPKHGEGVIVMFDFYNSYAVAFNDVGRNISTIDDDFYNQLEPVEDLPNVGEYAYFWDDEFNYALYAKYEGKSGLEYLKYSTTGLRSFQNVSKTPPKFD